MVAELTTASSSTSCKERAEWELQSYLNEPVPETKNVHLISEAAMLLLISTGGYGSSYACYFSPIWAAAFNSSADRYRQM